MFITLFSLLMKESERRESAVANVDNVHWLGHQDSNGQGTPHRVEEAHCKAHGDLSGDFQACHFNASLVLLQGAPWAV